MRLADMIERFSRGWGSGGKETICGQGAKLEATESIRALLPGLVERYDIRTVVDAGAGDLNWIRHVKWHVNYLAFDLVPRHPEVRYIDITSTALPSCDVILCRAVLNHLDAEAIDRALELFRLSARYLLATQYHEQTLLIGDWAGYDLRNFGLGEPLEELPDCIGTLALWDLHAVS